MAAVEELFKAVKTGDTAGVAKLVEEDSRLVDARDPQGMSALITAVYYQKKDIADLLLEKGAKPDVFAASAAGLVDAVEALVKGDRSLLSAFSPDGWTALHLAAHFDRPEVVKALIRLGADHRAVAKNAVANQPLQAAAAGRASGAIEALLHVGAEVDAPSHAGITALHTAAQNGDLRSIDLLLGAGADPRLATEAGRTAVDFARDSGSGEAVRRLEAGGARPVKVREMPPRQPG
jgi:ankyrin repeat protein